MLAVIGVLGGIGALLYVLARLDPTSTPRPSQQPSTPAPEQP